MQTTEPTKFARLE